MRKRVPKDASNTCSVIRDAHETFSISSGRIGIARVAIDEPPTKASGNTRTVDRSRVVPRRRCHASEAQKITLLFLEIVANETKKEFIVLVPSVKSSECPNVSLQTARIKLESRYPSNYRQATVVRTILQCILHGGCAACQFHWRMFGIVGRIERIHRKPCIFRLTQNIHYSVIEPNEDARNIVLRPSARKSLLHYRIYRCIPFLSGSIRDGARVRAWIETRV